MSQELLSKTENFPDFYSFSKLNSSLEGDRLDYIEDIYVNTKKVLNPFRKKISRNASKSENTVGVDVFIQKEITMKVIYRNNLYVSFRNYNLSLKTFQSHLAVNIVKSVNVLKLKTFNYYYTNLAFLVLI